jgi:hypothetical protein
MDAAASADPLRLGGRGERKDDAVERVVRIGHDDLRRGAVGRRRLHEDDRGARRRQHRNELVRSDEREIARTGEVDTVQPGDDGVRIADDRPSRHREDGVESQFHLHRIPDALTC